MIMKNKLSRKGLLSRIKAALKKLWKYLEEKSRAPVPSYDRMGASLPGRYPRPDIVMRSYL